jgi:ATP-dependent helicase/nuclease subunit A
VTAVPHPQLAASDPGATVFVEANAGSGKTHTLVTRVARLLLGGTRPEAILCVTYTKAGAAEMQRRLFGRLGGWAIADDDTLDEALDEINERGRDHSTARALFARALETPGGLKIQTIHAFCEQLLRRFPLEAGVAPGFTVLEDVAARRVSTLAREGVAGLAMQDPSGTVAAAYAHFSVELDWSTFNAMFADFEARRAAIRAYIERCEPVGGYGSDVWFRCGFQAPTTCAEIEAEALGRIRFGEWKRRADLVAKGTGKTDGELAAKMRALSAETSTFAEVWRVLSTASGTPAVRLGTQSVDPAARAWLKDEQDRLNDVRCRLIAARVAEDTVHALTLALAYIGLYEGEKDARGALDFSDLIDRAHSLLTEKVDAAWVLYKLDGGIDHVLLDEAQDTSPEQWEILRALTGEFFTGLGARGMGRTLFTVGDAKQSIFSFQGAAPERLALETQAFSATVTEAGLRFEQAQLLNSWRSTPEILAFVDAVFAEPGALAGLRPGGENLRSFHLVHKATRRDHGCVEVWPVEVGEPAPEPDAWDAPVDAERAQSPNKLLAARIATAIGDMVARGDGVGVKGGAGGARPVRFGDVLILVRRRGPLFDEIIRALKREGIPLAGADRLKLARHGVFEDLLAIGRFACFAEDDLTLAGLLRGPFCDVGEESLFELAHYRKGGLWRELCARADEQAAWRDAVGFLGWARNEARAVPPFDFYSRVLGRLDGEGLSMRRRILTRLGAEAEEALDAFLAQALEAEGRGDRDLETFIAAMATSELEIKREQDEGRGDGPGEVRVMTVHGAKGLEAPVVILPDTSTRATAQGGALLADGDGGFLWAPRKADDCDCSSAARELRDVATRHESARLLYVALTRARDRLIVCGIQTMASRFEDSWYDHVRRGFDNLAIRPFELPGGGEGWRYGADPEPASASRHAELATAPLPSWATGLAPAESPLARYASPSGEFESAEKTAPSPLAAVGGLGRYRRGDLIHRLLQILPDLSPDRRAEAATRMLARERDLSDDQRQEMAGAALAVLNDPRFAEAFGPGSRAEVALAGTAKGLPEAFAISARVDRLVVEATRVLVVDFKTNRPAPDRIEDADPAYILQMALYAAVLAEVFPGRRIEAALVWTDGPRLMPVPEPLMAAALDGLPRAPTSNGPQGEPSS